MSAIFAVRHIHILGYALYILFSSSTLGCAQPEAAAVAADTSAPMSSRLLSEARIIVKFDKSVTQPSSEAYLKGLSKDAGVELAYVRAMAGDNVHVFVLEGVSDMNQLQKAISALTARRDVIYVEQDRRLRHQRAK